MLTFRDCSEIGRIGTQAQQPGSHFPEEARSREISVVSVGGRLASGMRNKWVPPARLVGKQCGLAAYQTDPDAFAPIVSLCPKSHSAAPPRPKGRAGLCRGGVTGGRKRGPNCACLSRKAHAFRKDAVPGPLSGLGRGHAPRIRCIPESKAAETRRGHVIVFGPSRSSRQLGGS